VTQGLQRLFGAFGTLVVGESGVDEAGHDVSF